MDAVIDIGSNSVRLMLDRGWAVNKKDLVSTVLSDGLAKTGFLSDEAMERTLVALSSFVQKAKTEGADNIYIFATEAMRSAENGQEFANRIQNFVNIKVDIVSGEQEALLGLLGAYDGEDELTVVDIGGASVEVVRGNEKRLSYARSLPLGMVRLIDTVGSKREDIEKFVQDKISGFGIVSGTDAVAIGGTATSLASMDLGQKLYDQNEVHNHILTLSALRSLTDRIFASNNLLLDFPTLSKNRARVIGHGAIMLSSLVEYLGLDEIRVSEHDNLEGYLYLKRK